MCCRRRRRQRRRQRLSVAPAALSMQPAWERAGAGFRAMPLAGERERLAEVDITARPKPPASSAIPVLRNTDRCTHGYMRKFRGVCRSGNREASKQRSSWREYLHCCLLFQFHFFRKGGSTERICTPQGRYSIPRRPLQASLRLVSAPHTAAGCPSIVTDLR